MVRDCSGRSQNSCARSSRAGGSSCLPFASAPMAATCVPGRTQSASNSGARAGVAVTITSAAAQASRGAAARTAIPEAPCPARRSAKPATLAASRATTSTVRIGRIRASAAHSNSAWFPAPKTASTAESGRARTLAATASAAAVR